MIINKCDQPKAVIVGNDNLINSKTLPYLLKNYVSPLGTTYYNKVVFISLSSDSKNNKYLKKDFEKDLEEITEYCQNNNVTNICTTSPKFWQFATKDKQFSMHMEKGDILDGVSPLSEYKIIPLLNYFALHMNPLKKDVLNFSIETFKSLLDGTYETKELIIDKVNVNVLDSLADIEQMFSNLIDSPKLTLDIEGTGLRVGRDRVITLAFATDTENGWSIPLCEEYWYEITKDELLATEYNNKTREMTKEFFLQYEGEQIWQNHGFDLPFIVRDTLEIDPTQNKLINDIINKWTITDTMILKYLCVNSLNRQSLGLKEELMPIYGEYDKDVDQSRLLEYSYYDVGKYNVYDATGTFEMYNKYKDKVKEEGQDEILKSYYEPSMKTLLKVKCKGFVVNMDKVNEADGELKQKLDDQYSILSDSMYIQDVEEDLQYDAMFKYNNSHVKQKTLSDFSIPFNPNSVAHKKRLLIDIMDYPILETTKTGNPSLGKDVIKQYRKSETDEDKIEILDALQEIANASKVSGTFFKAFKEDSVKAGDETYRLHADYKLTGTVSGRLSSANPNLQNLPSGSIFGKLLKSVCDAPKGFLFTASDYNALEDFIIAEYTQDEVKKKILLDGYDSHSLYLASYIPEKLKELGLPYGDITKEESFIIKSDPTGKKLRDSHKPVTFALAYQGTEHTVAKSLGTSLDEAKLIVENYAKLHWRIKQKQKEIAEQAATDGYGLTPFGLKIRSSQLQSEDDSVAQQAMRSLTNAIYQGPAGMVMIKALTKAQNRIEEHGYDDDIIIMNTIHDAGYAYVREDLNIIKWYNDNLIDCMVEDYKPDQKLKLRANLDIGYDWSDARELPNNCSIEEIADILNGKEE